MPTPIHIAAIVPYRVYPAKMGGQKGIACFYEYLNELLPVTMITTKQEGFKGKLLPVLGDSRMRYINPALYSRVKRIILNNTCTHLIAEHPYFGWLAVTLKKNTGVALIIHSHNIESLRFRSTGKWWWRILWYYERYTHRNADQSFFITDEDRQYAIRNFKLAESTCHTITYGFELAEAPSTVERHLAADNIRQQYRIPPDCRIVLFNGTLHYKPNLDAVNVIINKINPLLLQSIFQYRIIICGKGLPEGYKDLQNNKIKNIIYAGFVDDISVYFKAADIFINPITDGGGIKTKLVEALGYNVNGVSTTSGAIGIPVSITGNKLKVVEDGDWKAFAESVITTNIKLQIPDLFFQHFYWGNIAKKAKMIIEQS